MPTGLYVMVREARGLPIMDRKRNTTDCVVEVVWGDEHKYTEVKNNDLNPKWDNASWEIRVLEEARLQDEPLIFNVMDHDSYSAGSLIGTVVIDLNTMIMRSDFSNSSGTIFDGWMPIYDTIYGIRGELYIVVSMEVTGDKNQAEESSPGIFIFSGSTLDKNEYQVQSILGFVEALVVDYDPEFEFEERFRSSQKSNEKRQKQLYHLSMQLRRQVGKQAEKRGANAVLGYQQFFDMEGDSGIVGRAYGTACNIKHQVHPEELQRNFSREGPSPIVDGSLKDSMKEPVMEPVMEPIIEPVSDSMKEQPKEQSKEPCKEPLRKSVDKTSHHHHHHHKDDEQESCVIHTRDIAYGVSHKLGDGVNNSRVYGLFNNVSDERRIKNGKLFPSLNAQSIELLSIRKLPDCFRYSLYGVVASRAVKFIGKLHSTLDDRETRDTWWESLRDEVRANALRVGADLVVAYRETCSIHGDICLLSATGTAVKLRKKSHHRTFRCPCEAIHVDLTKRNTLYPMQLCHCCRCKNGYVPMVVLSTSEIPSNLETIGTPLFIQSCVAEEKNDKDTRENSAKTISQTLPFIEVNLYNQLLLKLQSMHCNAVFGLSVEMEIGGSLLVATITGTAVYIPGLPDPGVVRVQSPFPPSENENLKSYTTITEALMELQISRKNILKPEIDQHNADWDVNMNHQLEVLQKIKQRHKARQQKKKLQKTQTFSYRNPMDIVTEDIDGENSEVCSTRSNNVSRSSSMELHQFHPSLNKWSTELRHTSISSSTTATSTSSSSTSSNSSSSSDSSDSSSDSDSSSNEATHEKKHKDKVTSTLCEVHPEKGVIDRSNNEQVLRNKYYPWIPQKEITFHTLQTYDLNIPMKHYRPVILLERVHMPAHSNLLNKLLRSMCSRLCYKVHRMAPCSIIGLDVQVRLPGEDVVEICLTALIAYNPEVNMILQPSIALREVSSDTSSSLDPSLTDNLTTSLPLVTTGKPKSMTHVDVFLTPLSTRSGYYVKKYCGLVVLHFIREGTSSDEKETIHQYNHKFLLEVLAVTKAHVSSIGGNTLLSFHILPQETAEEDVQKAYNMVTISGDAAFMEEI